MLPWYVCTMPKEEGGLGFIDVTTHGSILVAKWVVMWLEASSPWNILMWHRILTSQHVGKVRGWFDLCDIISSPQNYQVAISLIFKSIWMAWRHVAKLLRWKMSGNILGWDLINRPIWSWNVQGTSISNFPHI